MVNTDGLQRPSTDMSKIIVAVGIGLFSLLILNIFDLLSFWTLVAALVGVALVLKYGAPSVGTVVAILAIIGVGSVLCFLLQENPTWDFSEEEGWKGLTHSSGARIENGFLVLAPGAYVKRNIGSDNGRAAFKLKNVKLEDGSILQGEITDKTGRGNSATFLVAPKTGEKGIYMKITFPRIYRSNIVRQENYYKDETIYIQQPLNIEGSIRSTVKLKINEVNSLSAEYGAVGKSDQFSIALKNTGNSGEIYIDQLVII